MMLLFVVYFLLIFSNFSYCFIENEPFLDSLKLFEWNNKVKWNSLLDSVDHPSFALISNDTMPLTLRHTRRKRCTCGCSGCDLFPNRVCCGSNCCEGSKPIPLACCPPPPPPKPCCQPNYGPCCPATPNCCRRPCCKGRRPEIYEEEDIGQPPVPPAAARTCCPPAVPPAPPPPPVPPPPPPETPIECCAPPKTPNSPCGCSNCGCGRPCCFYRDAECCRTKPCCPPALPCCPPLPTLAICCNVTPPCLRACPTCPCRKRIHLGKRLKRQNGLFDSLHCQNCMAPQTGFSFVQTGVKTAILTTEKPNVFIPEEPRDIVEKAPMAKGKLFENSRHIRIKRAGCQVCVDGKPLKREKRNACTECTYLEPKYSSPNMAGYGQSLLQTSIPVEMKQHLREKRNGCIPPPTCLTMRRRSKRNYNSQYCEPCPGGYPGRKKREDERQQCMNRRKKRATEGHNYCEDEEDSSIIRMKRQAYNQNGILDMVKVLSKITSNRATGANGCLEFPACVLAKKKRRKRQANRVVEYQKTIKRYKRVLKEHEKIVERHKRQFFAPDAASGINCVPCPAWVTLALTSRKRRDVGNDTKSENSAENPIFGELKEALKDIRRREQQFLYEENECEQTADCMNDAEYGEFMRKYNLGKRKKRQSFLSRKQHCVQCQGKTLKGRAKRAFGAPTINASAGNCNAFPACRTRVKRHNFECNVCTSNAEPLKKSKRAKRNFGNVQCYPCPSQPIGK